MIEYFCRQLKYSELNHDELNELISSISKQKSAFCLKTSYFMN